MRCVGHNIGPSQLKRPTRFTSNHIDHPGGGSVFYGFGHQLHVEAQPIKKAQQRFVSNHIDHPGDGSVFLRLRPSVTRWDSVNQKGPVGPGPFWIGSCVRLSVLGPFFCTRLYKSQSKWVQSGPGPILCSRLYRRQSKWSQNGNRQNHTLLSINSRNNSLLVFLDSENTTL